MLRGKKKRQQKLRDEIIQTTLLLRRVGNSIFGWGELREEPEEAAQCGIT